MNTWLHFCVNRCRKVFFLILQLFGCTVKHNLINSVYKNTDESITKSWFYNGTQSVWDPQSHRAERWAAGLYCSGWDNFAAWHVAHIPWIPQAPFLHSSLGRPFYSYMTPSLYVLISLSIKKISSLIQQTTDVKFCTCVVLSSFFGWGLGSRLRGGKMRDGWKKSSISINFTPHLTGMEMDCHCSNKERLHFVQKCDVVIISSVRTCFINVKYGK